MKLMQNYKTDTGRHEINDGERLNLNVALKKPAIYANSRQATAGSVRQISPMPHFWRVRAKTHYYKKLNLIADTLKEEGFTAPTYTKWLINDYVVMSFKPSKMLLFQLKNNDLLQEGGVTITNYHHNTKGNHKRKRS